MKQTLFIILWLAFLEASGQEAQNKFDGKKWEAPYFLDIPQGWDVERFLIPISFAPSIPYKGVEDIRFTPGWGKKEGDDYWSYAFLWYLDGTQEFNAKTIERNLVAYYTGLAKTNIDTSKVNLDTLVKVNASVKNRKGVGADLLTFEGKADILDFITLKPISLNLMIHIRYCKEQAKTVVFHEASPRMFTDKVWKDLDLLWTTFRCVRDRKE